MTNDTGTAAGTVLITGGAGFIGSNLARHFRDHAPGWTVRVIDDLSTGSRENLEGSDAEFFEGSILDLDLLTDAMRGVDAVVHLAAVPSVPRSIVDPRRTHDVNATGTLNVLEVARSGGAPHVIVASSSSVYGSNPAMPKTENDWTRPLSPYGVSKLATEGYAIAYQHSYGLPTLAFRFFNVYGPGQDPNHDYAAVVPAFLHAALHNRPLVVHGDGTQSRDFTYVGTVCSVLHDAVVHTLVRSEPVNLAFGTCTTLMELVTQVESTLGHAVTVAHDAPRAGDIPASQADGVLIKKLYGTTHPIPLDEGIAATASWLLAKMPPHEK